jgi:chorismate mutase
MADPGTDPELQTHRELIAANDRKLVEALNARVQLVQHLKRYKEAKGYAFLDVAQEARVLEQVCLASEGPVSEEALCELFATILAWTKREVERLSTSG